MSRYKGRRYSNNNDDWAIEGKELNIKKVIGVALLIILILGILYFANKMLNGEYQLEKISSTSYLAVFNDNKWGVIDNKGEYVIVPSYAEMIVIPDEKEDVFLCTYDVNYETGEYKTKALNSKNEEILSGYQKIEAISNLDINNTMWYEQNVIKYMKDGKYGLLNLEGNQVLTNEYDNIEALKGTENALLITKNGLVGIADATGTIIINPEHKQIRNLGIDNKDGYIVTNSEGKEGIVDYSNNMVLKTTYESVKSVYGNDMYVVTNNGKEELINKEGNVILSQGYNTIVNVLNEKDKGVVVQKEGKYGILSLNGDMLIEAKYDQLVEANNNIFIATIDGKTGVIDSANNEKVPFNYSNIKYTKLANIYITEDSNYLNTILNKDFETKLEGMVLKIEDKSGYIQIKQGGDIKYYDFKFNEKSNKEIYIDNTIFLVRENGKYGYIDAKDKKVVECIYDDATEQNEYGFAAVKKDGKWGVINSKGELISEINYNLDDYLIVNFIGKWHLGKDLNVNYYNKFGK